jgi:hypothetical protein
MKTLDLKKIRKLTGLKASELAVELFPNHKNAYNALNYVESGRGFLDSSQISKLSEITEVPIGLLFDDAEWEMGKPANAPRGTLQFKTYDYVAELNTETMVTVVYRNGVVIIDEVQHNGLVEISEYLSSITDLLISKHNQK